MLLRINQSFNLNKDFLQAKKCRPLQSRPALSLSITGVQKSDPPTDAEGRALSVGCGVCALPMPHAAPRFIENPLVVA
jgi:hypothetical protein